MKLLRNLSHAFWSRLLPGPAYARLRGAKVGKGCRMLTRNFGSEPFLIEIGDDVHISTNVTFITHDGAGAMVRDEKGRRYSYRPIKIGSHTLIGANTLLLPGVVIGSHVIIAAGSVVTKSIPDNCVVGGNPAKFICSFNDFANKAKEWPSAADMPKAPYKDKVLQMLDRTPKPYIRIP